MPLCNQHKAGSSASEPTSPFLLGDEVPSWALHHLLAHMILKGLSCAPGGSLVFRASPALTRVFSSWRSTQDDIRKQLLQTLPCTEKVSWSSEERDPGFKSAPTPFPSQGRQVLKSSGGPSSAGPQHRDVGALACLTSGSSPLVSWGWGWSRWRQARGPVPLPGSA